MRKGKFTVEPPASPIGFPPRQKSYELHSALIQPIEKGDRYVNVINVIRITGIDLRKTVVIHLIIRDTMLASRDMLR